MDFDLKLACQCAEAFSVTSGVGCTLYAANGDILLRQGNCCGSCRLCELGQVDPRKCSGVHIYGMHEAERFGGKYIYFCAMGLTCFTSPIVGPESTVAQLTVGPFLMVDEQDYIDYELSYVLRLPQERIAALLPEIRKLPHIEAARATSMAELLFMAVAFMNNVAESNRLLERSEIALQQGQISAHIHELNRSGPTAPYPFEAENLMLQAMSRGDSARAQQLLNELLGHILFSSGGDQERIFFRASELLVLMSRAAANSGINPETVFSITSAFYREGAATNSIDALCHKLTVAMRGFLTAMFSDKSGRHLDTIHRTVHHLQTHYAEKFSLEDLARTLSISPYYLSRIFRQETGSSLGQFLAYVRVEKSKQLLTETDLSLSQIAQQCGFSDQSYYTKVFRRCCGTTPHSYRREHSPL